MANTKASQKDIRRIRIRTERNRQVRSRLKTLARQVREARTGEDPEAKKAAARAFVAASDRAVKTGQIHANKAARHKRSVADLLA